MSLLMFLLVVLLLVVVAVFIIDKTIPGDLNWIAKLVVGVIALVSILQQLGFAIPGL